MGVIYKLTDDVKAFILDQKKWSPDLSCRELVELVVKQFDRVVSKSSVHEVLKEANIVSPRGRKFKNKFQIPVDKKAQLIANLPSAITAILPTVPAVIESVPPIIVQESQVSEEEPLKLRADPTAVLTPQPQVEISRLRASLLPPLEENLDEFDARSFFLQAAFYDLFPKPWNAVKTPDDLRNIDQGMLKKEKDYRFLGVACFKVELQDGNCFYVDARGQRISSVFMLSSFPVPLETAVLRMADTMLNNIHPLIIHQLPGEFLDAAAYDFLQAMDNAVDKQITRLVLLDNEQQELTDFSPLPRIKRKFILGLSTDNKDAADLLRGALSAEQMASSYVQKDPVRFICRSLMISGKTYRGIVLLNSADVPYRTLISNMEENISPINMVVAYLQAYPQMPLGLLERPRPEVGADLVLEYAQKLFGNIISGDMSQKLASIKTRRLFNASLSYVTICAPTAYDEMAGLESACDVLNNLNIFDFQGRKIWACVG